MTLYLGEAQISSNTPSVLRNIGEIVQSAVPLNDGALHLLDGSLINGSGVYSDFVNYIAELYGDGTNVPAYFETEANWQTSVSTYGVCGKFVYDSVNNTVRLPKITGIVEGTTDPTALGDLIEQFVKLPNITGTIKTGILWETGTMASGCFTNVGSGGSKSYPSGSDTIRNITLDASRSSSVYSGDGTDTKIQPQALKVLYYIVLATSSKTEIQVDIDDIATDLNGKADVDFTNVNNTGTSTGASWSMPSSSYTDLTLGSAGTQYTAPANGWYVFGKRASGVGQYFNIQYVSPLTCPFWSDVSSGASGNILGHLVPVKKGQIIKIDYNVGGATTVCRFIYAEGSKSEA